MNDAGVSITIADEMLEQRGYIDLQDFVHLMEEVFFRQLETLWGCNSRMEYRGHIRGFEIDIRCPVLLAKGIEDKLYQIMRNPNDRSAYEVDSYPQNRRLNVARPPEDMMMNMDFAVTPSSNDKVGYIEVPPPEVPKRKRKIVLT